MRCALDRFGGFPVRILEARLLALIALLQRNWRLGRSVHSGVVPVYVARAPSNPTFALPTFGPLLSCTLATIDVSEPLRGEQLHLGCLNLFTAYRARQLSAPVLWWTSELAHLLRFTIGCFGSLPFPAASDVNFSFSYQKAPISLLVVFLSF